MSSSTRNSKCRQASGACRRSLLGKDPKGKPRNANRKHEQCAIDQMRAVLFWLSVTAGLVWAIVVCPRV